MAKRCPVLIAFNTKGSVVPVYCGQWSCEYCRKKLAKMWSAIALLGVKSLDGKARFWTLTLPSRYRSITQGYQAIPKLWDTLRKIMQREYKTWHYLAFVEGQPQRGYMPHFHIITMSPIPASYPRLKELAVHVGFGFQADDKLISGRQAAAYVAKYASKGTPQIPRGFRRVRPSAQWPKLPDKEQYDAYIVQQWKEPYSDYLLRVHAVCSVDVDTLHKVYQAAYTKFMHKQTLDIH